MKTLLVALLVVSCGSPAVEPPSSSPVDVQSVSPDLLVRCRVACAMPSATIRATHGLNTSPNPFSQVPEGALLIGDEVVAREAGVLTPRRGLGHSTSFVGDRCFSLPTTNKMLCTALGVQDPVLYDPATDSAVTVTRSAGLSTQLPAQRPYGTDPRAKIQAAAAKGNLYFTTATAPQAVPGITGAKVRPAGLPRPEIILAADTSGLADVVPTGRRRVYRVTLGLYDELGNFLESAPGAPTPYDNNSGGNRTPQISVKLPLGSPPNVFLRLWRSLEVPAGTVASDDMFLVAQINPGLTSGTVPNGFLDTSGVFTLNDVSPDSMLTVPLYTNRTNGDGTQGIAGANVAPPAAGTIFWFKGRMYYGRTTFRQSVQVQFIGTGTGGVQNGDTITVDGSTFTVGIDIFIAGSGIAAQCANLGIGLASALNQRFANGISLPEGLRPINRQSRATYISLGGSDFGRVLIERIFPSPLADDPGIGFSVTSVKTGGGGPSPGIAYPTGIQTSTDGYIPGGVSWSKVNLPEAVPAINSQAVGDPNAAVLGATVLRDVALLWKEDGVWVVRDDGGPQPTFNLLDPSAVTIAPDSLGVIDNIGYGLTNRGVLQISEQGTVPVGESIRGDLVKLINQSPNGLAQAFAVSYDSERLYILGVGATQYVLRVPDAGYPPSPPQWTRWLIPGALHGMVLPTNRLAVLYAATPPGANLLAVPSSGARIERKGGIASLDFFDFSGLIANPATTTTNLLTFAQDVHQEIQPGDLFTYNPGGVGTKIYTMRVTAVDNRGNVTLDASYPFTAGGTLTYYRAIRSHWRYAAIALGEPTAEKLWESVQLHFDYIDGDWVTVSIDANKAQNRAFSVVANDPQVPNTSSTDITQIPWLRPCRDVILRCDPGQAEARAARLGVEVAVAQALSSFRLTALAANAEEFRMRSTR